MIAYRITVESSPYEAIQASKKAQDVEGLVGCTTDEIDQVVTQSNERQRSELIVVTGAPSLSIIEEIVAGIFLEDSKAIITHVEHLGSAYTEDYIRKETH